jgi:uncharacterized damage-inducible protein DinB
VFTLPGVRKFYDWTHASLTLLLNHLSTIPATEYAKEVPGFGFPTVHAQVIHIFNCEGFWIHTLQAIPFEDQDPANWPTVSDEPESNRLVPAQTTGKQQCQKRAIWGW